MVSNMEEQNKPPPFSRSWIHLNLGLKGFTIRSFAKKHGVKPGTVGVVFSRPYPRMERLIADTIGIPPESIWPDRYGPDGKPNRHNRWYDRGRVKNIKRVENVNGKKETEIAL